MTKGWNGEKVRHSVARKFGKAPPYKKKTVKLKPKQIPQIKQDRDFPLINYDTLPQEIKDAITTGTPSKGWSADRLAGGYFDGLDIHDKKAFKHGIILMDAEKFLHIQHKMSTKYIGSNKDFDEWIKEKNPFLTKKRTRLKKGLQDNNKVPIPFIEITQKNEMKNWQEGRNRGIEAMQRGEPIPVMIYQRVKTK